ncbi:penicillin-binding protein, beta-lactamase class C [Rheinheimera sp. A13L]|uniref:serine hydrolase domain-containing protein n=1 Tax=Rheinheimera sp. A13L TaxID=506534 RepID=UPI0002124D1E|nr:serine hydrolase [Rheinheimera sp. A13L]EGM79061.1 penicillin-binding protein, beta-lactamase class C [Rheinheimera sp. A13L]
MNKQLEDKIQAWVTQSSIPQLDMGLWHHGRVHHLSYGCETKSEVDVFEIGSVGKTFTATLLAVFAEHNLVHLNDELARYKPDLPFAKDITLLQLATHTSGLPRDPFKGFILGGDKALRKFSHADYTNFLNGLNKPLKSGKFNYSNIGMALLGNLLADHMGSSYEDAVKKYILEPLGMTDTHISFTAYAEQRLATGHNGNGKVVPHFQWNSMEPAGLWRSTSKDMMVFLKAHLGYSGERWKNLLAKTTAAAFNDPKCDDIGLAWMLSSHDVLGDFAWHNGQTMGQKSVVICAKNSDAAIVMLSNKVPKFWQNFFPGYSIENLSAEILKSFTYGKQSD